MQVMVEQTDMSDEISRRPSRSNSTNSSETRGQCDVRQLQMRQHRLAMFYIPRRWLFMLLYSVFSSRSNLITPLSVLYSLEPPQPSIHSSFLLFTDKDHLHRVFVTASLTTWTNRHMSLPVNPPTGISPDSTPSGSPEPATTILIQRVLASQACALTGPVTLNIPLFGSTLNISRHGSTIKISFYGFAMNIPLDGILMATVYDLSNCLRHAFGTLFASLKGILSRSPDDRRGADSRDEDDPHDEDYDPSNDDDREALDADETYEYGSYRLDGADWAIAEQQQGSISSRTRSLRWLN